MTFKVSAVENITKEQIKKVTADKFHKYYSHAIKEEDRYRRAKIQRDD